MEPGLGTQSRGMLPRMKLATALDLAELERHEVVDGELVEKAAPSAEHGGTQATLVVALGSFLGRPLPGRIGGWWLMTETEVELSEHEVYLPDVAGWRIARVPERPTGKPVCMAPDWVCEILSPSTALRDLGHKRRTYHRARVGHYWIVDPHNRTLSVFRWQEHDDLFVLAAGVGELVRAEPFEAAEIVMADIFGVERPI